MNRTSRSAVMVSASMPSNIDTEIYSMGWFPEQIDDCVSRLSRVLLRENLDVVYGGIPNTGFTKSLLTDTSSLVIEPRFISFVGWPYSSMLSSERLADDFGICRYVIVDPPKFDTKNTIEDEDAKKIVKTAIAISKMRKELITENVVDIDGFTVPNRVGQLFIAGKSSNFFGTLPGVFEEYVIGYQQAIGQYVIGAFGGASKLISESLMTGKVSKEMTFGFHLENDQFQNLVSLIQTYAPDISLENLYDELQEALLSAHQQKDLKNGLTWEQNIELMSTKDVTKAVRLLGMGIRNLKNQMLL